MTNDETGNTAGLNAAPLYRPEVFQKKRHLEGDVYIGAPMTWHVVGYTVTSFVVIMLVLGFSFDYADRRLVQGWLTPPGGLVRVTARDGGVVEALLLNEGDEVAVGQELANINRSRNVGPEDIGLLVEQQADAQLAAAEVALLEQRRQIQTEIGEGQLDIAGLQMQRAEAERALDVQIAASDLAKEKLARHEKLSERGFVSKQQLEEVRTSHLRALREVSSSRSSLLAIERQIGTAQALLRAKPIELARIEASSAADLAGLQAGRAQARYERSYTLVAPIRSRIVAVTANIGDTLSPGATTFILSPLDQPLEAELFVPSSAIGLLQVGQTVSLRYEAFPYQVFGTGNGMVTSISETNIAPGEVPIRGLTISEPTFRVRARLENAYVNAYGKRVPLQPGMLIGADIIVAKRSLIEWLLEPLYAVGRRSDNV